MVESCPLNNAEVIKNPENIELKKTLIVSVILKLSILVIIFAVQGVCQ